MDRRVRRAGLVLFVVLAFFAFIALILFSAWSYTSMQLAIARSQGVYPSAEEGMRELLETGYTGITRLDILYAGPNSSTGRQPHVWYVIAEVRASRRADGSELGARRCDAPGSFFIQTNEGWVHMPEGAFPEVVGQWMDVFGLAGPGQSTPSTDWPESQPNRLCQSA
jgi:hypothetical protein